MHQDLGLGKLIDSYQQRDCIHIAVAPVFAVIRLAPGQDVGLVGENEVGPSENPIGIIDPFLKQMILPRQRCWLFLYPGTVTAMRHEWKHPSFAAVLAGEPAAANDSKTMSRKWLEEFAKTLGYDMDYETMMNAAARVLTSDDRLVQDGSESWRDGFCGHEREFWRHYEIVTGQKVEDHEQAIFCCSC